MMPPNAAQVLAAQAATGHEDERKQPPTTRHEIHDTIVAGRLSAPARLACEQQGPMNVERSHGRWGLRARFPAV
jgi:hypothetical protein